MVTALRVTAADDRSPFIVRDPASLPSRAAVASAANAAGLLRAGVGWAAEHPERVVMLFAALGEGWVPDPDDVAARGLAGAWDAALADEDAGAPWSSPAPGESLVRARGCVPYPYQEVGARRLHRAPGGLLLADAPGLGKTLQVLAALPTGAAVNVACPRNAVPTWEDEVARWRPDLTARSLKKRGSATPAAPGEVVVGTLESLPLLEWADRARLTAGATLVCDEAHALKGDSAQARRFASWSDATRAVRGSVWLLSGTPVLNADPAELWRLLDACGRAHDTLGPEDALRSIFGHRVDHVWVPRRRRGGARVTVPAGAGGLASVTEESVEALRVATCEQVEKITWTGEHPAWVDEALARAVLRRTKEHVARDMPAITYQDVRVHVPRDVLRELARADASRRLEAELDALARAVGEGAREDELDRLAAQPAVATARRLLAAAKVPGTGEVLDALADAGEPALLFSSHVEPARELGARAGWAVIDGSVTGDRRGRIRHDFQAGAWSAALGGGSAPGLVAVGVSMTIRAASESLTLTRAAEVVFLDRDWVPSRNEQAACRAHRIGQKRSVTVRNIIADHPVDRRIAQVLAAKTGFGRALLAGVENR